MTPEQCAQHLGIKINTLYVMKSQGRIPYRKVGHLLRFDFEEIVEWTKNKKRVWKRKQVRYYSAQTSVAATANGGDVL